MKIDDESLLFIYFSSFAFNIWYCLFLYVFV